jgi:hypothetical protein
MACGPRVVVAALASAAREEASIDLLEKGAVFALDTRFGSGREDDDIYTSSFLDRAYPIPVKVAKTNKGVAIP